MRIQIHRETRRIGFDIRLYQIYATKVVINYMNSSLKKKQNVGFAIENSVFSYQKYSNTYFVPVYPRAYVQEVVGIDHDRRTVTAHFVIHVTVCCKVDDPELRKFLRRHLILQFGYNQTIYIPEIMKQDNPFCIITEVVQPGNNEDYVTYKIRGNLECSAHFDLMLFPFRQIEVNNHLVFRTQTYRGYNFKYNAMMLIDSNVLDFSQFSPHITFPEFAGYRIRHLSTEMATDQSKFQMKKNRFRDEIWGYLKTFINNDIQKIGKPAQVSTEVLVQTIFNMHSEQQAGNDEEQMQKLQEMSPFKHVLFKFEMMSLKPAFVFQNEVPIWVLAVLSLYTFTAHPDIGNRYGNIVLLIVSFVSLFTNFRVNNVGHASFTFYEIKLIIILFVPVLLIISTVLDYYSNTDTTQTTYALRQSQIDNPFMLVSLIVVLVCFITTVLFILYVALTKYLPYFCMDKSSKANRNESESMWQNLVELEWQQPKLLKKISRITQNVKPSPIRIMDHDIRSSMRSYVIKKSKDASQFPLAFLKLQEVKKKDQEHFS